MKKNIALVCLCFISMCLAAQSVVSSGKIQEDIKIEQKKESEDESISPITEGMYQNIARLWSDWFYATMSFDATLEASLDEYYSQLKICLKDSSAHKEFQHLALGEVFFYRYFAQAIVSDFIVKDEELESCIDDFLSELYPSGLIRSESELIERYYSFYAMSIPYKELFIGKDFAAFIKNTNRFVEFDTPSFDYDFEKVMVFRSVNTVEQIKKAGVSKDSWLNAIKDPSVWYLIENCSDFEPLKNEFNNAGFDFSSFNTLEGGYLSDRAYYVYALYDMIPRLEKKSRILGLSMDTIISDKTHLFLEAYGMNAFLLSTVQESSINALYEELKTFEFAIALWSDRLNALTFRSSNASFSKKGEVLNEK